MVSGNVEPDKLVIYFWMFGAFSDFGGTFRSSCTTSSANPG